MYATQSLLDVFWSLNDDGAPLSAFQRILLMIDGTVTDVLEAYANEPVSVVKLAQSFGPQGPDTPQLDLDPDERVLARTVLLRGSRSGTNYLHAESAIAADRLAPGVVEGLLTTGKPLGKLLAQHRVETFREIVALGYLPAGDCADYFGVDPRSQLIFRTYRIHVQRRPLMRITEKFPVTWFAGPLDH